MRPLKSILIVFVVTLASCGGSVNEKQASPGVVDIIAANMDTTIKPGEDFFRYSCGTWMKNNPIPGNERGWGIWSLVQEETYQRMKDLSLAASDQKNAPVGTATRMIGDFYSTGMDTVSIDRNGIEPLRGELNMINDIHDAGSLRGSIARLQAIGADPGFDVSVFQDEKNSAIYSLHLSQGGIGLPDRDYYFNNDSRTVGIRKEYPVHISRIFTLTGLDSLTASRNAATIMKMESDFARASRKLEALRDPYANYNKMTVKELNRITPSFDWNIALNEFGCNPDSIVIGQPEFFKMFEKCLKAYSLNDWKVYLTWNLINNYADVLSHDFEKQNFAFYGTILSGVKEQRPRWKRVLDMQESALGDALGQLYVEKYVSPSVKQRYEKLTTDIFDAYRTRIAALPWMSDTTKKKSLEKLNSVIPKVAYPDKWKDYSNMKLSRASFAGNWKESRLWLTGYHLSKLNKAVDRTEWQMTPQTYNAYYNPSNNEIVLPAAIFIIPGVPDSLVDDAVIYGYAGASTIGHEITHGFDDQGRQFDAAGNLNNWWTPSDEEEFTKRAKGIVKQFSEYVVLDSLHINGEATQGENIADLGGIILGLEAFKKTEQFKNGKTISGLTPVQRYFLGYALGWLGHFRDETIANRVMTDVHSPNFLRVNGPFSDVPEWYEAFQVQPGDKFYRPDSMRVMIW